MGLTYSLTEARTEVRNRGDFNRSIRITDAMLNEYINSALRKLQNLLIDAWVDYVTVETSLAATSGVSAVALPSDFYKLLKLDILDGGEYRTLHPFNLSEQTVIEAASATVYNYRYRLQAGQLILKPTPASAATLRMFYAPKARKLQSHSATVDSTAETLNIAGHGYKTGDGPFKVATSGSGLTAGDDYWFEVVSSSLVKVHTSQHNALTAATPVNLTGAGSVTIEGAFEDINGFGDFVFYRAMLACAIREERPIGEIQSQIDDAIAEIKQAASPRDASEPFILPDHTIAEDW